jgi:hypothetical protein
MNYSKSALLILSLMVASSPVVAGVEPFCPESPVIDPGGYVSTSNAFFQSDSPSNVKLRAGKYYTIGKNRKLNCGSNAGCVLFVQSQISIVPNESAEAVWTICVKVDGALINPTQGFEGEINSVSVATGTYQGSLQVAPGQHTVTLEVGMPVKAKLSDWHEAAQMIH